MRRRQLTAVLFDFDGTLAPNLDLPDMRRQVIALTRDAGVPDGVFRDQYIVEIITAAHGWLKTSDERQADAYARTAHELITRIELEAAQATRPLPGVPRYLRALKARDLKLGIVTRNCRAAVLTIYPEVLDDVHTLRARDDVTHLKPDPRHLFAALDDLDCTPEESAMVGDGVLDIRCGLEGGLYTVGVETGSSDGQALRRAGAHEIQAHCLLFEP